MKLNQLNDDTNKRKNRKRVGRGIGSGKGKTGGRGQKGQTSRSGVSINGFEGGQMPIYRRVPKRGFVNPFRITFQLVNIGKLEEFIASGVLDSTKQIDKDLLLATGIINRRNLPVKLLANGKIKSALNIKVDAASEAARKAVEKAGGKVEVIAVKA